MVKYRIIIANQADEDLFRMSNYLSNNKFKELRKVLKDKYRNIIKMPWMYPRLYYEKKTKTDFRKIVYQNYIIIYKIQKNQIIILRIVSEKENYLKPKLLEIY